MALYTIKNSPFPIQPHVTTENITTVSLKHNWTESGKPMKRSLTSPVAGDPDIEVLLYVIKEFDDLSQNNCLHLNSGAKRFQFFREVLTGTLRNRWDVIVTAHGNSRNNENDFLDCRYHLINTMVDNTSSEVQDEYFRSYTKRYQDTNQFMFPIIGFILPSTQASNMMLGGFLGTAANYGNCLALQKT